MSIARTPRALMKRYFNGYVYHLRGWDTSKENVKAETERYRKQGHLARTVKIKISGGLTGYGTFVAPGVKRRK